MSNKTITIPSRLGTNQISDIFGKIHLSKDLKDILDALHAEIMVRYHPGAKEPIIEVVAQLDRSPVCSFEELKALSGCRRFATEIKRNLEKTAMKSEKVKILAYYLRALKTASIPHGERILEGNLTKFNQIGQDIKVVNHNLETIESAIDNKWKDYLKNRGGLIKRVLHSAQKNCLEQNLLEKDYIDKEILSIGVPKWIYKKFLDRNWTNNLKNDCVTLLFPKNNYLKSIALTTFELLTEEFLTANEVVVENSGTVIAMAKSDLSLFVGKPPDAFKEQGEDYLGNYFWTLMSPYTSDEILAVRETGKQVPVFRESYGKTGVGNPELSNFKEKVDVRLGLLQSTWMAMNNFVLPIYNPIEGWWKEVFPNSDQWTITPTKNLYNHIRSEQDSLKELDKIRACGSKPWLKKQAGIVAMVLKTPSWTVDAHGVAKLFVTFKDKSKFRRFKTAKVSFSKHPIADVETSLKNQPVSDDEIKDVEKFLGLDRKKKITKKTSGAAAMRIHRSAKNELENIKSEPYYNEVVTWLMTTFKSGKPRLLQTLAAQRVAGEFFKDADKIFTDYDEDALLETIEQFNDGDY